MKNENSWPMALGMFLGLAVLGFCLHMAAASFTAQQRSVVVKGLAERDVKADRVVWPISFRVSGNTLEEISAQNTLYTDKIVSLLTAAGLSKEEITVQLPNIDDKTVYASEGNAPLFRYTLSALITVNSAKVDVVAPVTEKMTELMNEGLSLTKDYSIQYSFTQLNELKPKMIEEATINARQVAEKFAKDSQSYLGKIKKANQGLFSITTPDTYKPEMKKVRIVSTIEYYLVD